MQIPSLLIKDAACNLRGKKESTDGLSAPNVRPSTLSLPAYPYSPPLHFSRKGAFIYDYRKIFGFFLHHSPSPFSVQLCGHHIYDIWKPPKTDQRRSVVFPERKKNSTTYKLHWPFCTDINRLGNQGVRVSVFGFKSCFFLAVCGQIWQKNLGPMI